MILGLDISTSITGWCVIGEKGGLCDQGYTFQRKKLFLKKQQL